MIFKYSDNTKSGSGLEEVKRIINFHLNRRPNQGQQKQGQKRKGLEEQEEDLRQLIERKKAKKNAGKESGEKGRDRGTGSSGMSDQSGRKPHEKSRDKGTSSKGEGDQSGGKSIIVYKFYKGANNYNYNYK